MCRSSGAFGRPDAGDEKTPTGGEEVARVPAAGDAYGSDHAVAGPEAEQLADWISELCETGSKHLPAALWLLAETPTSAWDLLHPTASDGKNQARLAELEQFDSENDAWYFGVWVNRTRLRILRYVEGDVYFTQYADAEAYDAEIASLCAFHEAAPSMVVIDDGGKATAYYQNRRDLFIDPERATVPTIPEPASNPEGE